MSTWYQFSITAFGNREAIGKFFNLDPALDIHYIDRFSFSFGQKNVPGLRLDKLIEQNPDLIFLNKLSIECSTVIWSIERFHKETNSIQRVFVQNEHRYGGPREINKKLFEEYLKQFPTLVPKHEARERGYEEYRWEQFLGSFENMLNILNHADEYHKMICPISKRELEFDDQSPDFYIDKV